MSSFIFIKVIIITFFFFLLNVPVDSSIYIFYKTLQMKTYDEMKENNNTVPLKDQHCQFWSSLFFLNPHIDDIVDIFIIFKD